MKSIFLTCSIVFFTLSGYAQNENAKESALRKLSNEWMTAAMNRDRQTLDNIVAPEFKLGGTNIDGTVITRELWLANTMEKLKIDSINYIKMKFDIMETVAIVQCVFYWSVAFAEFPAKADTVNLVDTWVKKEKGWQVVSRLVVD